jgi:rhodanese-related sulfurtransferase
MDNPQPSPKPSKRGEKMKIRTVAVLMSAALIVVFTGILMAAEKNERAWPEEVDQYVAAAKKSVTLIDMEAFKKVVDAKGDIVILDVREPDEYKAGFVPGAINIPRGMIEFSVWKTVAGYPAKTDTKKKIYVYCALSGRSALAAKALKDLGFTNVTAVDMKFAGWVKSGYAVAK